MNSAARLVGPRTTRPFVAGLYVGALAIAMVMWLVGVALWDVAPAAVLGALAAAGAIYLALTRFLPLPYPQNSRQVPSWVTEGAPGAFFLFGAEMGTGSRTFSPTVLPHLLAATVVLAASGWIALAAALGFASGRSMAIPLYRRRREASGAFSFKVPAWLQAAVCALWAGVVILWLAT